MKKREIILITAILGVAFLLWGVLSFFGDDGGDRLRITVNQEVYGEYSLAKDQTIRINDTNVCQIKDGKVTMTEADCPDHLCMDMKAITKSGGTIICLPNKVMLEIISENGSEIDTIAS